MVEIIIVLLLLTLLMIYMKLSKKRRLLEYILIEETEMGLIYEVTLPSVLSSDVVKRLIKVEVDGESYILELNRTDTTATLKPVPDNSTIRISLNDVDDAGNNSGYGEELVFTALDTIPPSKPGMPKAHLVAETDDIVVVKPPVAQHDPAPPEVIEPEPDQETDESDTVPDTEVISDPE